jgi:hypothetical protein
MLGELHCMHGSGHMGEADHSGGPFPIELDVVE